jgi:ribosomal protein L35
MNQIYKLNVTTIGKVVSQQSGKTHQNKAESEERTRGRN